MGDYVVKLTDETGVLSHSQRKGAKWGVVTRNVGKYYIPKGVRSKASEMKKMHKMDANQLEEYLAKKRKDKDKVRIASKARKGKDLSGLSDEELKTVMNRMNKEKTTYEYITNINKSKRKLNNQDRSDDNDDNNKNNNNKNNNNGKKDASGKDLVEAAKDLRTTFSDINKNYQKNPPTKKQKTVDLSDKTDAELRRMIERAQLEQRYEEVVNTPQVDSGKMRAAAAISAIGTAVVVGTQVANLVGTIKEVKKI